MLLGSFESVLNIAAPLHRLVGIRELLVRLELTIDTLEHAQGVCLELRQVAGGHHAGDFDVQGWQGLRRAAYSLHHDGRRHVFGQVLIELLPAGADPIVPGGIREHIHGDFVLQGAIGHRKDQFLGLGD